MPTTPADCAGACVDCFPAHTAFPGILAGRHPHYGFRGLLRLTHVTARWIAQSPKATFVTRLQPARLPDQAARQLPDQSTTLRVAPSSTGDTRPRGAQNTIRKQWICVTVASKPCSARGAGEFVRACRAQSLYCANRPRPARYLWVQAQAAAPSGAIKRLRPTTHTSRVSISRIH